MRSFLATMARSLAAVLVLAVAIATAAGASLRGWRDGPVVDLLTEDEYRRFGQLRTDAARRAFIERFWIEIEKDAGMPPGEYHATFEKRCAAANARFRTGGQEGWRTDRGRVFLALGEPLLILREPGGVNAVEKEVWTYRGASGTETPLRIVFYRCVDGGHRLDASCAVERDTSSVAYDVERADYLRTLRDQNAAVEGGRLLATLNGLLLPVPGGVPLSGQPAARLRAPHVPPRAPSSVAAVTPGVHALESAAYFFRAQDGTVLTLLTLELLAARNGAGSLAEGESPAYLGAASVEEAGRRGEELPDTSARTVLLDAGPAAGEGGRATFFGRVYLKAGRSYAVRYAVKDGARDEILVRNALLGVPHLSGGFSASSIVPAEQFGPAGPGMDRYQVGSEEVVPKAGGVFRRSELLRLYLQVYDAAIDPETSMPRVDVLFRFYRAASGSAKRHGKPFSVRGATGASMGLALPIGDWPLGPYRVVVDLHDRVAEERTTAEGSFSIAAD